MTDISWLWNVAMVAGLGLIAIALFWDRGKGNKVAVSPRPLGQTEDRAVRDTASATVHPRNYGPHQVQIEHFDWVSEEEARRITTETRGGDSDDDDLSSYFQDGRQVFLVLVSFADAVDGEWWSIGDLHLGHTRIKPINHHTLVSLADKNYSNRNLVLYSCEAMPPRSGPPRVSVSVSRTTEQRQRTEFDIGS